MAGTLDLCSNLSQSNLTPDFLRKLAFLRQRPDGLNKPVSNRPQELSKRLGEKKVAELVRRAEAGESVRSLAQELSVANSALTRMLRAQGVTIQKRKVSDDETAAMAKEYEAGATMREIEAGHGLSHGAVLRSLHKSGVEMRAKAPRTS
ncbi:helix-turn-helix domain-containing protein [Paramicrobacterium agarici]|uniref:helix-turn-helix domain-containing protein n=1 Tax=Paramicrobacterium agarici TaxID=630514 RepID=UPI001153D37E|nr:helix-turn-helix domain-containing protein [Microbacterium agarici]